MFDNNKQITREFLLKEIGEVNIFRYYLNLGSIKEDELICNPLRTDKTPTASFKYVNDRIQFRDWSQTNSMDCFNVAQVVTRKKTFYDTLIQIALDFGIIERKGHFLNAPLSNVLESLDFISKTENVKKEISIVPKDFHRVELNFWRRFGIDKDILKRFKVFSVSEAYVDDKPIYSFKESDICFAYYFGNGDFKLYFPFRKKGTMRFIHNNASILQGFSQLPLTGNHCLITKSYKDVISLSIPEINSVAPMSESIVLTDLQYEDLKNRFNNLFVLYDNDMPGRKAMIKALELYPDLKPLLFKQGDPKDYTDNIMKYGLDFITEEAIKMKSILLDV